ncbi:probable linoleate 9S-lipoxygenase 5 isoform X2 [Macadamia integrifolia]|uniref:probable linoleate 9S-lipoxygenase 5 isoform X2 n=1 Tax=Macadamia integrifolia TaxID=60698 RepID=UPI001C4FBBE7|nr:probable linoleate 9S-lipoxygenase 5 isoform X2 [Macadamia integrifolia]
MASRVLATTFSGIKIREDGLSSAKSVDFTKFSGSQRIKSRKSKALVIRNSAFEELLPVSLRTQLLGQKRVWPINLDATNSENKVKIRGSVVLMKKNLLDLNDYPASIIDWVNEFLGKGISLQLISSVNGDPGKGMRGRIGEPALLENWITKITKPTASSCTFQITFDWDETMGIPGAFIIKNLHHHEFFLKTLTLDDVPGKGRIHFVCNSWVYPVEQYNSDRIFFANQAYLPTNTPEPLRKYREQELVNLRGDGIGELKEWDRVYDYACYNDLGDPDKGPKYVRPVFGGSKEYPYPRRGRTGRKPTKTDPKTESRLPIISLKPLNIYVPRDEQFDHVKMADILAYALKAISQLLLPALNNFFDRNQNKSRSMQDIMDMYEGGIKIPNNPTVEKVTDAIPLEMLKELFCSDGEQLLKFPMPQVIKNDKSAWRTDEEFAREMLSGVNPVSIRCLQEFPPTSKLNPDVYGNHTSLITKEHIEKNLNELTVDEAIKSNKLFILDYYDALMPYLRRINTTTTKTYAARTILFLKDDGTLKPVAIELCLPHPDGDQLGPVSKVFTPAEDGVEGSVWQLAKAYVAVNDSGFHQLITHWLKSHSVMEPFAIAMNRQLSVLHPIHKLLYPHFRDTMKINSVGRQILINANGIFESTVFPGKFALELSTAVYKNWVFPEQALPADLVKRGMAIPDSSNHHGLQLVIEDYPYAVDGLEIWSAIETWVHEYCSFYYPKNEIIQGDSELQSWWSEIRNEGHGDLKDESWWPKMQTLSDLIQTCTIIIWIASAFHAAVNFGQYPYAGYLPNRPTISRRFMPEPGTPEYAELKSDPDTTLLKTITGQLQTLLGVSVVEILSRHSSDEVYLGQRDTPEWTSDAEPLEAFQRFRNKLMEIEKRIMKMNEDPSWKNRVGPVKMPYTLLYPDTSNTTGVGGLTGKGIPNSVSI